ncbi:hypothetical protein T439DRAFT_380567 [Meredithblackwellia eburnea MCA 4105]
MTDKDKKPSPSKLSSSNSRIAPSASSSRLASSTCNGSSSTSKSTNTINLGLGPSPPRKPLAAATPAQSHSKQFIRLPESTLRRPQQHPQNGAGTRVVSNGSTRQPGRTASSSRDKQSATAIITAEEECDNDKTATRPARTLISAAAATSTSIARPGREPIKRSVSGQQLSTSSKPSTSASSSNLPTSLSVRTLPVPSSATTPSKRKRDPHSSTDSSSSSAGPSEFGLVSPSPTSTRKTLSSMAATPSRRPPAHIGSPTTVKPISRSLAASSTLRSSSSTSNIRPPSAIGKPSSAYGTGTGTGSGSVLSASSIGRGPPPARSTTTPRKPSAPSATPRKASSSSTTNTASSRTPRRSVSSSSLPPSRSVSSSTSALLGSTAKPVRAVPSAPSLKRQGSSNIPISALKGNRTLKRGSVVLVEGVIKEEESAKDKGKSKEGEDEVVCLGRKEKDSRPHSRSISSSSRATVGTQQPHQLPPTFSLSASVTSSHAGFPAGISGMDEQSLADLSWETVESAAPGSRRLSTSVGYGAGLNQSVSAGEEAFSTPVRKSNLATSTVPFPSLSSAAQSDSKTATDTAQSLPPLLPPRQTSLSHLSPDPRSLQKALHQLAEATGGPSPGGAGDVLLRRRKQLNEDGTTAAIRAGARDSASLDEMLKMASYMKRTADRATMVLDEGNDDEWMLSGEGVSMTMRKEMEDIGTPWRQSVVVRDEPQPSPLGMSTKGKAKSSIPPSSLPATVNEVDHSESSFSLNDLLRQEELEELKTTLDLLRSQLQIERSRADLSESEVKEVRQELETVRVEKVTGEFELRELLEGKEDQLALARQETEKIRKERVWREGELVEERARLEKALVEVKAQVAVATQPALILAEQDAKRGARQLVYERAVAAAIVAQTAHQSVFAAAVAERDSLRTNAEALRCLLAGLEMSELAIVA